MFKIHETDDKSLIELEVKGDLTKEDYDRLEEAIVEKLKESEKVNILGRITELSGMTAEAILADFKLLVKHYSSIEKMAVVSSKEWVEWVSKLGAVLPVEIKYFDVDESDLARNWLMNR
jgi:hypothetical protein